MKRTEKILSVMQEGQEYTRKELRGLTGYIDNPLDVEIWRLIDQGKIERSNPGEYRARYRKVCKGLKPSLHSFSFSNLAQAIA